MPSALITNHEIRSALRRPATGTPAWAAPNATLPHGVGADWLTGRLSDIAAEWGLACAPGEIYVISVYRSGRIIPRQSFTTLADAWEAARAREAHGITVERALALHHDKHGRVVIMDSRGVVLHLHNPDQT